MRILILGGDGYLGWPTAMRFSQQGHECTSSTTTCAGAHQEVGTDTLVPILDTLPDRTAAWKEVSGQEIGVTEGDLVDWDLTVDLFGPSGPSRSYYRCHRPPTRCAIGTTRCSRSRTTS